MHRRNILVLMICQALCFSGASLNIFLAGLIGSKMAPSPAWGTLPNAITIIGLAISALPASFAMRRWGRRRGFMAGALLSAAGACSAFVGIQSQSFALYCVSLLGIGANVAFVQQYRFAAIENASESNVGKALTLVLAGGIIASVLGPWLAQHAPQGEGWQPYALSYGILALLQLAATAVMSFYQDEKFSTTRAAQATMVSRPVRVLFQNPLILAAVFFGMVSYAIMTFVMTATPVSMHLHHGLSMHDTALTIQSHGLAMYVPSLLTVPLLRCLGVRGMLLGGIFLFLLSAIAAVTDQTFPHYWLGLVLLGIAWNLMFVSSTVLLGRTHNHQEKFKVQAINDGLIFSSQAVAAIAAGAVLNIWGWEMVQWICFPPLMLALIMVIYQWRPMVEPKPISELSKN